MARAPHRCRIAMRATRTHEQGVVGPHDRCGAVGHIGLQCCPCCPCAACTVRQAQIGAVLRRLERIEGAGRRSSWLTQLGFAVGVIGLTVALVPYFPGCATAAACAHADVHTTAGRRSRAAQPHGGITDARVAGVPPHSRAARRGVVAPGERATAGGPIYRVPPPEESNARGRESNLHVGEPPRSFKSADLPERPPSDAHDASVVGHFVRSAFARFASSCAENRQ
jgi:hypothetical protein